MKTYLLSVRDFDTKKPLALFQGKPTREELRDTLNLLNEEALDSTISKILGLGSWVESDWNVYTLEHMENPTEIRHEK